MGKDEGAKVRFITDLLKVEQVVGENASQASVIRDIALPGRVRKIADVDTSIRNVQARVIENKVIVEGVIHKQIFYVDDDTGQLKEFTVDDERFVHFVDVPGAMPGMNVQTHARIEFVGHDFIREITKKGGHGGKHDRHDYEEKHDHDGQHGKPDDDVFSVYRQTVILEIFAKVTETLQLEVVVDVHGVDPKKVIKELLKVESVIGENASQTHVKADVDFGRPARKIKNIDTQVRDIRTRVVPDKVIVEATLHKQIFFVSSEDDVVYEVSVDERFTHFVDVPGAFPGANVQVYPRVEFVDVVIDAYDRTMGRQTAIIDIFVKVTETVQVEVVTDIIGVKVNKELLKVSQVVGEGARQHKIVMDLVAPAPVRKMAGPPDTRFENISTRVIEDKVIIEGDLVKQIFIVREGYDDVVEFEVRERFNVFIDIPGARPGQVVQVYPRVEYVDFEIDPRDKTRLRQIVIIEIFVKVTEFVQLEVVVEADVPPAPFVKVYVVQKGDTLFTIAQRFGTTVDAILKINPEIKDPNKIFPGQKILIPSPPKG